LTGTFINIGAVLAGTLAGVLVGARLPAGLQERVLRGLGLVTLVIGIELALEWPGDGKSLAVLGGVLLGGIAGEALDIEGRLSRLGDRLQEWTARDESHSTVSEAFFTASLLFCVGPLAVVGAIQDGLTGEYEALATKAMLDGFASVALAASLGWGVALSALVILAYQGGISLGAGLFDTILAEGSDELACLTSAGGILIIGIALKLLDVQDVKVGNFLPALLFAPALVALSNAV
jgi:uncharacterized membrane protein YqgA involved in biofilm formation